MNGRYATSAAMKSADEASRRAGRRIAEAAALRGKQAIEAVRVTESGVRPVIFIIAKDATEAEILEMARTNMYIMTRSHEVACWKKL